MKTDTERLVIADSSGIISLINPPDSDHRHALRLIKRLEQIRGSIIVPEDVYSETVNIVGRKLGHQVAVAVGKQLLGSAAFILGETSAEIREAGFEMFEDQSSAVSLTDCLVMAWAEYYDTRDIFGFDAVFRQNGYRMPAEP